MPQGLEVSRVTVTEETADGFKAPATAGPEENKKKEAVLPAPDKKSRVEM